MFETADERRRKGGTEYVELQVCMAERGVDSNEMRNIRHWADSSLYVHGDDLDDFCQNYGCRYFQNGLHMNMERDQFDPYGVNYFSPSETREILEKIVKDRPIECETVANFLKISLQNHGFYILGL